MLKPIRLEEFIKELQYEKERLGNVLVGLSVDSEGNAWSLIPNEEFMYIDTCDGKLGYQDFDSNGKEKVIILFGSN